jgi:hypothetical protein
MTADGNERRWLNQWARAQTALRDQRARELRALSDDRALAAAEALLAIVDLGILPERRRSSSGLVEQQAVLHRRSRRESNLPRGG